MTDEEKKAKEAQLEKRRLEQEAADKAEREALAALEATAFVIDSDTAIAAVSDLQREYVPVPEWKDAAGNIPKVQVRSLTSNQQQRVWDMRIKARDTGEVPPGGINATICAMGMIRADGTPIYQNETVGAVALGGKHPEVISRISAKIQELSNATKWQREQLEKKSEPVPSASSLGS